MEGGIGKGEISQNRVCKVFPLSPLEVSLITWKCWYQKKFIISAYSWCLSPNVLCSQIHQTLTVYGHILVLWIRTELVEKKSYQYLPLLNIITSKMVANSLKKENERPFTVAINWRQSTYYIGNRRYLIFFEIGKARESGTSATNGMQTILREHLRWLTYFNCQLQLVLKLAFPQHDLIECHSSQGIKILCRAAQCCALLIPVLKERNTSMYYWFVIFLSVLLIVFCSSPPPQC